MAKKFYDEQTRQSEVKSLLVSKYFDAWANIMIRTQMNNPRYAQRIAYIDLFAGRGKYEKDEKESTPLLILKKAIANDELRKRLVTVFTDKANENVDSLKYCINNLPGIETLTHQPQVTQVEVGEDIVATLRSKKLVPTLFFIDPWGYKGLSLDLINTAVKDFGCDCIFFFNYNRVNAGLDNELVESHMNALFGPDRANKLREKLEPLTPEERESTIIEALTEALREGSREKYVLPFRFKNENGTRTSHYLIFVSKGFKGYEEMKRLMAKESSLSNQGVATFEYNPADKRNPLLFELTRPIEELAGMLLKTFAGQTLTMREIYEKHNVGTPFISKNYKDVLSQLEKEGKIHTNPSKRSRGFADDVLVTFPR